MSSDGVIERFKSALGGIPQMITNALSKRSDDFRTRVEAEIDRVVGEFNIEAVVRDATKTLLEKSLTLIVQDHFKSQSGIQAIADHVTKILSPSNLETAPKMQENKSTEVVAPLFSKPLTLSDLKDIQTYAVDDMTPNGLIRAFNSFADHIGNNLAAEDVALVVNQKDLATLKSDAFSSYFVPITDETSLAKGQMGSVDGIEVYGDSTSSEAERFITQSGFVEKAVEMIPATATQKAMAGTPPA